MTTRTIQLNGIIGDMGDGSTDVVLKAGIEKYTALPVLGVLENTAQGVHTSLGDPFSHFDEAYAEEHGCQP